MAKMMFENLNAIVANTLTDSIKMIDIDELHESEDNFFNIDRIEEFAETILGQGGVKDNLIVRPLDTNGYEIISGHRRKAAVQYLLDNGENISRYLPCLIQNYDDNDDKILDIVLINVSNRQISDSEMWKSYEVVDKILMRKKEAGEKFGRVRNKLAECLGVSPAQVGKMQNVDRNAIEPVKEAVSNGEISISTANEIAKLDEDKQEEIIKKSDLSDIKYKDLKRQNKKVDTNINFSEDDTIELNEKKVDTNINFLEDNTVELDEETNEITLADFIHEHYFDLESIFTTYISMTDNSDETELLEEFQKLLYKVKEDERNKARFRL